MDIREGIKLRKVEYKGLGFVDIGCGYLYIMNVLMCLLSKFTVCVKNDSQTHYVLTP